MKFTYSDPVQLYTPFKGMQVHFIVRSNGGFLGDETRAGNKATYYIHSNDETIISYVNRDTFFIVLDEPHLTFIDSCTDTIEGTPDQIELLESMYKTIREYSAS